MATYIYRTETFDEDLAHNGYWAGRVDKKLIDDDLCGKLEFLKKSDNLWVYRFRKTHNAPRLIFQKIVAGEHIVLCALRFMGHPEYTENEYKWDDWAQKNRIEEASILQWLCKKIEEEKPKLKPLDDNLRAWLTQKVKYEIANDIYEMREWIMSFESKEWNEDNIYGKLYEIATGVVTREGNVKYPEYTRATVICTKTTNSNIYILCERIDNTTFLYNLYDHEPSCDELDSILRNYRYSEGDDVLKFLKEDSLRAYEEWILAGNTDKEMQDWKNIEHDKDGNLALSGEQLEILNLPLFPMFINGQAGSGKSTLLYFIFAMLYSEQINNPYKPIFLTYNERLLEEAKDSVFRILQNNPGFNLDIDESSFNNLFWPFQTFIKEKLLKPIDREQFPKEKYLSFNKFKKFYIDSSSQFGYKQKIKYSPELVWHIIRSYIEGRSTSAEFTIDDYNKLGRDDKKNVQKESLAFVINNIWKTWYKSLKEQGFWDDQDLVTFALLNKVPHEKYALIVCDEAQDFTRNEINLLLQLSVFSDNYDLEDYTSVPFAFAGDPYQTINPTGFRWESLKSMFDDMFGKLFRMYDHSMNEQPLLENYRSRPSIIQFANLIQLYRVALLSAALKPQELRSERTLNDLSRGMKPSLFKIGDNIDLSELKDSIKNTTIIVPCEGGTVSEREYAKRHDFLKAFIEIPIEKDENGESKPDDRQPPIPNLYSAAAIKGLERDKVIIFGFGEACPEEFAKSLSSNTLSDDESLVLSYFFNKLYVAASRAKNDLFIIDTPEGIERFWKHFQNEDTVKRFTKYPEWSKKLVFLRDGEPDDIARMGETEPAIIAKDLFEKGIKEHNVNWLQRAAIYYERAQLYESARRCQAEVAYLNEAWETAGDLFCNLNDPFVEQAQDAYWNGECWQKIIDMSNASENYVLVSKYMLKQISVYDLFANNNFTLMLFKYDDPTWVKVIQQIHNDLTHEETNILQSAMIAKQVADTWPLDYKRFYDLAAELYFRAKSYPLAAECWDKGEKGCEHDSYYESKLHTSTNSNQKVSWLYKLRRFKEVIIYDSDPHNDANTNEKILGSLILTKDYLRAVQYKKVSEDAKKREFVFALPSLSAIDQLNLFDALFDGGYQKFLKERLQSFKTLLLHKDVVGKLLESQDESFLEELRDLMQTDPWIITSAIEAIADELRKDNYKHLQYALDIVGIDPQNHVIFESKLINAIALASDNLKIRDDFRVRILGLTSKWFWEDKSWMQTKIISYRDLVVAAKKCQEHFSELYKMCEYLIQYEENDKLWALKYLVDVKTIEASLKKTQSKLTEYAEIRKEIRTIKSQITKIEGPKAQSQEKKETKAGNQEKKTSRGNNSIHFGKLIISGLSEFKSEKDERRGSITFELKQHDIKIYGKTSKIEIQSIETDDSDEINLEKHTYNKRSAKSCKKYRMRFSDDGFCVKFYVEGVEIIIKRENS